MSTAQERPDLSTQENRSSWLYISIFGKEPRREGVSIDLDGIESIELGRAQTTTIERAGHRLILRFADSEVSLRHAELRATTGVQRGRPSFTLEDLGSTNGTYVFGAARGAESAGRIQARVVGIHELTEDCCICVGSVAMHFVLDQPSWGPRATITRAIDLARRADGLATFIPFDARVVDESIRLAGTEVTIALVGEAGSGRTTRARALHAWSKRAQKPFVIVNAGIITNAAESFFYGTSSERGRGVFAAARGGTLFVRDLGKMHPAGQQVLFRALHAGEFLPLGAARAKPFDVRVILALDPSDPAPIAELERAARDHQFRVPPLRDRMPDIGLLLARLMDLDNGSRLSFAADAVRALTSHSFLGNLTQLARLAAECTNIQKHVIHAIDLFLPHDGLAARGTAGGGQRTTSEHDTSTATVWSLDEGAWTLRAPNGIGVDLTHQESVFLTRLFREADRIVARESVLVDFGKTATTANLRNLDNCVARLRRKVLARVAIELPVRPAYGEGYILCPSRDPRSQT